MARAGIKDLLYGFAVGDALGVPYEFRARGTFACTDMVGGGSWNQPAGTWSDDTSMTLATIASLAACRGVDVADMRHRFEQWAFDEAYCCEDAGRFDIGNTTLKALERGEGGRGERDNGNGSLMRILPLALVPGVTDAEVEQVSAITHAHSLSTTACVEMVRYARAIALGAPATRLPANLTADDIRSGGFVRDTLQASMWCLETSATYAEAVLKSVNLGEDTDTTAAVTGGLAGLRWGFESIPAAWVHTLRGKDVLDRAIASWPF